MLSYFKTQGLRYKSGYNACGMPFESLLWKLKANKWSNLWIWFSSLNLTCIWISRDLSKMQILLHWVGVGTWIHYFWLASLLVLVQGPHSEHQVPGPLASRNWPRCPKQQMSRFFPAKKGRRGTDATSAFPASENKETWGASQGHSLPTKRLHTHEAGIEGDNQVGAVSWVIPLMRVGDSGLAYTLPASVRWNRGLQRDKLNGNLKCIVVVTSNFSISIFYFFKAVWSS